MEKKAALWPTKTVLYVCPNGYLGGAEKVVVSLAQGHHLEKNFLPVILFFKDGEAVTEARSLGIRCYVLETTFHLSEPRKLFQALRELRALIEKLSPALTHHTMAYGHIVASLASLRLSHKTVWFQHGPVGGTLDKLATLFGVDLLLFNSQYLKDLHHGAHPHSKIRRGEAILRLGVESSAENKRLFKAARPVFGAAGRICSGKAFHRIIEALAATPAPFELRIAGAPKSPQDSLYLEELKKLVREKKLEGSVTFLGHQEKMQDFYQSIDVFIHAAQTPEPFGLVIAEAMAHGCLVIAPAEGGTKEFLRNNETGLSFQSTEELISKLQALKEPASTLPYQNLAREGRSFILQNYSSSQMVRKLEALYLELLD